MVEELIGEFVEEVAQRRCVLSGSYTTREALECRVVEAEQVVVKPVVPAAAVQVMYRVDLFLR